MRRISIGLLIAAVLVAAADEPSAKAKPDNAASWLWLGDKAQPGQVIYLRKTFELKDAQRYKTWLVAAADNVATVYLNGHRVLTNRSWQIPAFTKVNGELHDGVNVLAVRVKNTDGSAAGLMLRLELDDGGQVTHINTDESWKASSTPDAAWMTPECDKTLWSPATVVGRLGDKPWESVTERLIANIGRSVAARATPADKIKIKDGFRVELLYSVPRDEQGSWISMCTDPKGRLIVSDQYGGLFRVTPPPIGQRQPTRVERLPVDLGEAHGLLWAFDSLYVVVNEGQRYKSGLWRVRSADAEHFETPELLRPINGSGEHGPHAVLAGPDGKSLYVVIGNHTQLTNCATSLVPRCWAEDQIVPRMWDARGHAKGILAPGGHVLKTDPDGKDWQLVSNGYRNCYDAAFDREGELFTFDADMEWDMNMPWYRPTRICHVVSGSEFGWRSGSGKWPPYYPDSWPPVLNVGPGSPTGMTFGTGAKFPTNYQDALFCCDWSYGKLYAVHLTPDGSTYRGEMEEFLAGAPLPLTDIVINPTDGAMYFAIGGRKTTSGLYRVTYVGNESTASSTTVPAQGNLRKLRHSLEAFHGKKDPEAIAAVWPYLGHADRFIRSAARVTLEHQPSAQWQDKALAETVPQASLTALLALARVGDKTLQPKLLVNLDRLSWDALSIPQRLELLRVYELAFLRMGSPDSGTAARVVARFDPLFPQQSREVNAELARLLAYLQDPGLAAKAVACMAAAPTQEEQMEYANSLKSVSAGWTPEVRKQYFAWFQKAAGYRGGKSFSGFVDMIKAEAAAKLSDAEKTEFAELLKPKPQAEMAPPKPRPFVKKWKMDEIVPLVDGQLTGRDFNRGKELFSATRCIACHRYADEGGANGPDLTAAAGRFNVHDLLESIIEPSKVISDQYTAVVVTTADGKTVTGRIVNLNEDTIHINKDMFDPDAIAVVNRTMIESMENSKVSPMPEGLVDTCTAEEIKDLVAYLLSKGDRSGPMFRKK